LSRFEVLQSEAFVAAMPGLESWLWLPARAAMGDAPALLVVTVIAFASLAAVVALASASFGHYAIAAGSVPRAYPGKPLSPPFRSGSQRQSLRRKEWMLLVRDPWLLSQTLMQILYLVPPALLLWLSYGEGAGVFIVVVPVLVMACGQLAGGLAWLAISGEDAHDLVVTAPLPPRHVLRAKIEAVLVALAVVMAPILLLVCIASASMAAITALCAALAAGSATAIQLWFRTPMRRLMFRRRQVASRLATIAEAFVSIMWAGAAALLATGGWMALVVVLPAVVAVGSLALVYSLGPRGRGA
jgi:ABC-2 type transport system permease protein